MAKIQHGRFGDHGDTSPHVDARRAVTDLAAEPMDFYVEELRRVKELDPLRRVVDLGCGSGKYIVEAEQAVGLPDHVELHGVDIDPTGYHVFAPPAVKASRLQFSHGDALALQFPDSSMDAVLMNNLAFRTEDVLALLRGAVSLSRPGGLVFVTSNGWGHARYRHLYAHNLGKHVSDEHNLGLDLSKTPIRPPAHGYYAEQLPDIIKQVPELRLVEVVPHRSASIITRETLGTYALALAFDVNRLPYKAQSPEEEHALRATWRKGIEEKVVPDILRVIEGQEQQLRGGGRVSKHGPHFADPVIRYMFVLENIKDASRGAKSPLPHP